MKIVNWVQKFLYLKARIEDWRGAYMVWVKRPQRRRPLGRPRRKGIIILKWIFKN
jgi:hypothetical protein